MKIRTALEEEARELSALARSAKASWGYASQVMESWRAELTITSTAIRNHPTFVVETDDEIAGFYALAPSESAWRLEHLWVAPQHMSHGFGSALLSHALETARSGDASEVLVDADPNAESFYLKRGGVRYGFVPAPIPTQPKRRRPQLLFTTRSTPTGRPTTTRPGSG